MTNWFCMAIRNGFQMTLSAVSSVMAQDCGHVKVVIIDNGTDGTGHKIQQWESDWKGKIWVVDNSQQPASVARSWNQGMSFAFANMERDGQKPIGQLPVLVLNNDCILHPSTFRVLNMIQVPFVTTSSLVEKSQYDEMEIDLNYRTNNPDYTCYMIRRWVFEKVPFDENFRGAYVEDQDHHMRMHQAGIPAVKTRVPTLTIRGGTTKVNPTMRAEIMEAADHNRRYFESKWKFRNPPHDKGKYEDFFKQSFGCTNASEQK